MSDTKPVDVKKPAPRKQNPAKTTKMLKDALNMVRTGKKLYP